MSAPTSFERRLVSRRLRPAVVALAALAAAGVAFLAAAFAGQSSAGHLDVTVDDWLIAHFGTPVGAVRAVADLGGPVPVVLATLVLVVGLLRSGRLRGALLAVGAPAVATTITELILKPLVGRTHDVAESFPSGHATGVCALMAVVIVLVLDQRSPRLARWLQGLVCVGAVGLAVCVCAALAAAQYHYFSDTVGGAGVAVATALVLALIIDASADRAGRSRVPDSDHGLSPR